MLPYLLQSYACWYGWRLNVIYHQTEFKILYNVLITDKYTHDIKYIWNFTPDVDDKKIEALVKKVIDSNESYYITGAAGCDKSTLINMAKKN